MVDDIATDGTSDDMQFDQEVALQNQWYNDKQLREDKYGN